MLNILILILILIFNTNFNTKNLLPWQTLKHLSNKSESIPTIALRPRKAFIQITNVHHNLHHEKSTEHHLLKQLKIWLKKLIVKKKPSSTSEKSWLKNVEIMKKKHCGIDSLSSSSHQLAIRQNFLGELSKCLEFTQDQFSEELANKKKI